MKLCKDDIKNIKELRQQKRFDDIYIRYGTEAYFKYVPNYYLRDDLKRLLKEGKYVLMQEKYGMNFSERYIPKFLRNDIEAITGNKLKAHFAGNARFLKRKMSELVYPSIFGLIISSMLVPLMGKTMVEENKIRYQEEIEIYNEELEKYVNNLELNGLTDLEIIMKVVDDMWNSIDGYKNPEIDIFGFYRLDIPNGFGVCRNMADDITAKLNAINPEFNARNVIVYSEFGNWQPANIDIRNLNEPTEGGEPNRFAQFCTENFLGNHMVTFVDIKSKGITLVIDSTNGGIGVLNNGKVEMFNSPNEEYKVVEFMNSFQNGYDGYFDYCFDELKSYLSPESLESLEKDYGLDAQNQALSLIRK